MAQYMRIISGASPWHPGKRDVGKQISSVSGLRTDCRFFPQFFEYFSGDILNNHPKDTR
jgi:hypothetical protein